MNDRFGTREWAPDEVEEANDVALLLASIAYLKLPHSLLWNDLNGLASTAGLQKEVMEVLRLFLSETPD